MGLEEINGIIMATIVVVVVIGYGGPLLGKTYYPKITSNNFPLLSFLICYNFGPYARRFLVFLIKGRTL